MQVNYILRPDWRYQKVNEKFRFRLWVSCLDKRRDYQTTLEITKLNYDKLTARNPSADLKILRDQLKKIEVGLENYMSEVTDFDFDSFEKNFLNYHPLIVQRKKKVAFKKTNQENDFDYEPYEKRFPILLEDHPRQDSISVVFAHIIKAKLRHGKIGTATAYQTAYNGFKRFRGNVTLRQVTKDYLMDFKHYLLDKKASLNTVGMYARNMRTVFNEAIEQRLVKKDVYPFGRRRFLIPEIAKKKPVVGQNYIPLIINYKSDDVRKLRARDLWMFLYQANGMNVKDLCNLRYQNFKGSYFSFIRAKVEDTSSSRAKEINVYITDDMWDTIRKYGNAIDTPETFVFPFLTDQLNPIQTDDRIETIIYQINRWMKVIFEELGIRERSSTLLTRYSIANHLKQLGASTEVIKDLLGHSSVKTTEIYLNSFEVNVHGDYVKKLMDKHKGLGGGNAVTNVEVISG